MKRVAAENEKRLRKEIEAKRQKIGDPGEKVSDISFNSNSAMEVETETGTATQTEEFDYLFHTSTAKPPFDENIKKPWKPLASSPCVPEEMMHA